MCGCPVIAANAAAIPEITGDAALLVDPEDVPGMADAIYRVLSDRDLRDKILKAARTLRAPVSSQAGKAKLFGDDIRKQAQTVFEQDIKNYEQKNPNLPPTCDARKTKPQKTQKAPMVPLVLVILVPLCGKGPRNHEIKQSLHHCNRY